MSEHHFSQQTTLSPCRSLLSCKIAHTIGVMTAVTMSQVLIPDVQKLINQLGNVNTDLFASRLLKPPSSVLLLPLRASGIGGCKNRPICNMQLMTTCTSPVSQRSQHLRSMYS